VELNRQSQQLSTDKSDVGVCDPLRPPWMLDSGVYPYLQVAQLSRGHFFLVGGGIIHCFRDILL